MRLHRLLRRSEEPREIGEAVSFGGWIRQGFGMEAVVA